jgi:membrane fusion protein (multidrug efflux system)
MNEMTRIEGEPLSIPVEETVVDKKRAIAKRRRIALMLSLPLLIAAVGLYFWLTSGRTVSTDNAQVTAHVVSVSPEVSGRIIEVAVTENQHVKAGDLLYRIDPTPFRIALMQADAAVGNARLQIAQMESGYSARVADIGTKASDVQLAEENYRRQRDLLARGFTTRAAFDAARAALASAQSERAPAAADAQAARAMLGSSAQGGHPQVEAAIAAREKAALDVRRTEIHSPIDGIVSQTDRLNIGNMATQMLPNVSIVGGGDPWVEANFKETQLAKIRVGQPAEIKIDAIPGHKYKAHVWSIGAGTGSEFSLLPAQNATGNWVKVTQRVPVRLKFDEKPDRQLVSGWSAHVTVRVAR